MPAGDLDLESGASAGILLTVQGTVQARRRWFGLLFLVLAGAMLIWGLTWLKPWLVGLRFVFYWILCTALTGGAFVVGCADLLAVRREQQRAMKDLIKHTLADPPPPRRPPGSSHVTTEQEPP